MVRLKLSHVQESCLKLGFEFLDEKYKNNSFKHTFRCIKHDQVHKGCFIALRKGVGLRCCRLDRIKQWRDYRKHGIDEVRAACLDNGYELQDKEYLHINYKHHFRCLKHGQIHKASYKQIKRGAGLKCCHKKVKPSSEDYLIDKLNDLGFSLLGKFDGINEKSMLKCKKHGKVFFSTIKSLVKDHKKPGCCAEPVEPKTPKVVAPTDAAWRHETKEAAEFRCFVCRAKDLNDGNSVAHKVHIETEEEVIDSMVMCNDCSLLFHKKYGFTGNTSDQYEEFCLEHSKHTGIESTMRKIDWQIK